MFQEMRTLKSGAAKHIPSINMMQEFAGPSASTMLQHNTVRLAPAVHLPPYHASVWGSESCLSPQRPEPLVSIRNTNAEFSRGFLRSVCTLNIGIFQNLCKHEWNSCCVLSGSIAILGHRCHGCSSGVTSTTKVKPVSISKHNSIRISATTDCNV